MGAEPTLQLMHVYFREEQTEAQERRVQSQGTRPQSLSLVMGLGRLGYRCVACGYASHSETYITKDSGIPSATVVQASESSRWHL